MESDETLVIQAQSAPKGDLRSFEVLVERHQEKIIANCHYLTGSADDVDLGEPVSELGLLAESPAPGFLGRIRNSINRRMLAAETVDFSLTALFHTFFEYLKAAIEAFRLDRQEGNEE